MRKLLMAVVLMTMATGAYAGVLDEMAKTSVVAAATYNSVEGEKPVSVLFLANHDVISITDSLKVTMGVDIRAESGAFGQFSNLGIGGGLRYNLPSVLSIHAGYARTLVDMGAPSTGSDNRVFVGIGVQFRKPEAK